MKKAFYFFLLAIFLFTITGCNKTTNNVNNNNDYSNLMSTTNQSADKLEVYYFHRTARCYSCRIIEQYVREVMEQKYGEEIKNGVIDFRELNVELPENREVARKFQASGSSLFINRIINERNNIEQDVNVWRLLRSEDQFKGYLEEKINSYLGM